MARTQKRGGVEILCTVYILNCRCSVFDPNPSGGKVLRAYRAIAFKDFLSELIFYFVLSDWLE